MANGELQPRFVFRDLRDADLLLALAHARQHEVQNAVLELRLVLAMGGEGVHLQIGDKHADGVEESLLLLGEELSYWHDMQVAMQTEIDRLRKQDEMASRREND